MRRQFLVSGSWLLVAAGALATATPTPTPRPKLSGGFGRPRNTPAPTSDGGQSPADVARSSQANRGSAPEKSAVTIDNRSLVTNPDKGRVSTSKLAAPATPVPAPASASASAGAAAPDGAATGGSEAEWRATATKARKRVEGAKQKVAELSAAEKKLENDFYAWDDGQYRDRVIKPAWDRTRSDLEAAKVELAEAERELADLPEKARRAGALPGWIRE
jgi:hypothetical protein